jgi:hypothetical protein
MLAHMGEQERAGAGTSFNLIADLQFMGGPGNGFECPRGERTGAV